MDAKSVEKKNERISKIQKEKLVEYMSSNLEFARGQFGGLKGNSNFKEQWESLQVSLNCLCGSAKTVDQWRKCWIDLKLGVKKSVNARRATMNKTGGGGWTDVPRDLNPLEEKILKIITVDAVDGDSCTPESGFKVESSEGESIEEFEYLEFLEREEMCAPPAKKAKLRDPITSTSASHSQNMSQYLNALEETRASQKALEDRLDKIEKQNEKSQKALHRIEKQNEEILKKLDTILESEPRST